VEVGHRTPQDLGDTHLLGASLRSHAMCRYGKDSFRLQRSSVGVWFLLEDTRLKLLLFQDTNVLYLRLFSTNLVILNSSEDICDLLEKRSNIYSDRVGYPS
jgi:hypothetical protein